MLVMTEKLLKIIVKTRGALLEARDADDRHTKSQQIM